MSDNVWYAVIKDKYDNDWGFGSYSYKEAVEILRRKGWVDGSIVSISEGHDPVAIDEIKYNEIFE